jgi:hypothetical protein
LVSADLSVPSSPGLIGAEHATSTAHVTEGSLAGARGTSTGHAGNTGHSASSTPRDSRSL